jgi:hypothetical protein
MWSLNVVHFIQKKKECSEWKFWDWEEEAIDILKKNGVREQKLPWTNPEISISMWIFPPLLYFQYDIRLISLYSDQWHFPCLGLGKY